MPDGTRQDARAALGRARITTRPAVAQSQKRGVAALFMRPLYTSAHYSHATRGMPGRPERRAQKSTANAQWSTLSKKQPPTLIAGYRHVSYPSFGVYTASTNLVYLQVKQLPTLCVATY